MADAPRLFLITPPLVDGNDFAPLLETALRAADVACVLIRTAPNDEHAARSIVRTLAPRVQGHGAAALIAQDARWATRLDVDGVHVMGSATRFTETLDEALATLKPDRIVGVGDLEGRDAAMSAGEAGVDYVMFGTPGGAETHDQRRELVAWWAEIFTVPCVGYAAHPELAGDMVAAGAEFVGLSEGLWDEPKRIGRVLADVVRLLAATPERVP